MASWLFVQYLLSNEVQIAYSGTEGYVPVTKKAQESAEYQEYLAQGGVDNDAHYGVKIEATKLLLENVENTFVTPVFNGSASLRDAAGQMVENVTKSVRRKQEVNEAYMEKLYTDMVSLYRLNMEAGSMVTNEKMELGELPTTAKLLIGALVAAWTGILLYLFRSLHKKNTK